MGWESLEQARNWEAPDIVRHDTRVSLGVGCNSIRKGFVGDPCFTKTELRRLRQTEEEDERQRKGKRKSRVGERQNYQLARPRVSL